MSYADSVQRALDYIEDHLHEELDLSGLAEESYASVAQLYRMFYALTGHPVKDYIRKRRISVAASHLRHSNRKVEELAWDSGFESYHSFAKVFKKIVGLTPAAYRTADIYFSFEPIRLRERVSYAEEKEQAEQFPDVKVIRFMPGRAYAYLHIAEREEGMEDEAFRIVYEKLAAIEAREAKAAEQGRMAKAAMETGKAAEPAKEPAKERLRIFGRNVEVDDAGGTPRYGYQVLVFSEEGSVRDESFAEEPFEGGLYAVRKVAASPPKTVQDGWNRLVSEWLPRSAFEIDDRDCIEEFIAYGGAVARMHLYLPVRRKLKSEPIEIVQLAEARAYFSRGYGANAQQTAERRLIEWHERRGGGAWRTGEGRYYMSFAYGMSEDAADYWWENGILSQEPNLSASEGLEEKRMDAGLYACCVTKAYGQLTGVLEKMHRWIAANGSYRLDEERQWFAEYDTSLAGDVERDTAVRIYLPITGGGVTDEAERGG